MSRIRAIRNTIRRVIPNMPGASGRSGSGWMKLAWRRGCTAVEATPIERDLLLSVHTPRYLELLDKLAGLDRTVRLDADTYANPWSYEIARLAAGGASAPSMRS